MLSPADDNRARILPRGWEEREKLVEHARRADRERERERHQHDPNAPLAPRGSAADHQASSLP